MKAIMVMFDSLNRRFLPPYGCDWVKAPNFSRLAERTVTFDNSYVGSMPCMPARREIHTGRYNFLHRSWGPLEPFDDSMPELLKRNKIHTHLASDHYHYWEDGGCNYHGRYSTWEISRGQEGEPWKAEVPTTERTGREDHRAQDRINRKYITHPDEFPQAKTFAMGLDFLERNHDRDDWFLTVETFDPHEPFYAPEEFRRLYPHEYDGEEFDWPKYGAVKDAPDRVQHCRYNYAALVSMCDRHLGKVLDFMDTHDMWKDTMLIVNTDHGFLLGEHNYWAKCVMPFYNEVAHSPLFIWDPRAGLCGERRKALVQTIDLPATLLEYFGVALPKDMQGVPLRETIASDAPVREAGLFGVHGGHINCTDGRYVYMRAPATPENRPLYEYTLMPTHMRGFFSDRELLSGTLAEPFSFTRGIRPMRFEGHGKWTDPYRFGTLLFDLAGDYAQMQPIRDEKIERRMIEKMVRLMKENDCPPEQFDRVGLAEFR